MSSAPGKLNSPRWEWEGPHCYAFHAKNPPAAVQGPEICLNRKPRSGISSADWQQADPCGDQQQLVKHLTVAVQAICKGKQVRGKALCSSSKGCYGGFGAGQQTMLQAYKYTQIQPLDSKILKKFQPKNASNKRSKRNCFPFHKQQNTINL